MPAEQNAAAGAPAAVAGGLAAAYRGLTVCDLSQGIAGPHATMLLAQFGANVIKVEPPAGDWGRGLGLRKGDHCAHSWQYNLGKSSLCVDLKNPDGREVLAALASTSDIFVESFRPGVAARLGFGYDDVRKLRPDVIYASLSGFGQAGPNSGRGTVDALIQGFSGMMVMNRTPDGVPHRQNMVAVDVMSGLYLFSAISAAITRRIGTGEGCRLDISMMQSAAAFQAAKIAEHHLLQGKAAAFYGPVGFLPAIGGGLVVSCRLPAHFPVLCDILGCPGLAADVRFASAELRIANGGELLNELGEFSRAFPVAALLNRLHEAAIPAERVYSYGEWLHDEHVNATGAYQWVQAGELGCLPRVRIPGLPVTHAGPAPAIGEGGRGVLAALGYTPQQIADLQQREAVRFDSGLSKST